MKYALKKKKMNVKFTSISFSASRSFHVRSNTSWDFYEFYCVFMLIRQFGSVQFSSADIWLRHSIDLCCDGQEGKRRLNARDDSEDTQKKNSLKRNMMIKNKYLSVCVSCVHTNSAEVPLVCCACVCLCFGTPNRTSVYHISHECRVLNIRCCCLHFEWRRACRRSPACVKIATVWCVPRTIKQQNKEEEKKNAPTHNTISRILNSTMTYCWAAFGTFQVHGCFLSLVSCEKTHKFAIIFHDEK